MFLRQTTKKLTISYLVITLLTISTTVCEVATEYNPHTAVFVNQTCQHNKCYKFNLKLVQGSWKFLAREVTPSCCAYRAHNVTLYSQVTLRDSPYTMAEATTTPPQEEATTTPPQDFEEAFLFLIQNT